MLLKSLHKIFWQEKEKGREKEEIFHTFLYEKKNIFLILANCKSIQQKKHRTSRLSLTISNFIMNKFVGRSSLVKGGSAPTSNVIRILVLIPVQIES